MLIVCVHAYVITLDLNFIHFEARKQTGSKFT